MRAFHCLLLFVFNGCVFYSGDDIGDTGTRGTTGGAFISGRVTDAQTGRPVEGALVSTEPPTGTTTTNSQGMFSIETDLAYTVVVGVVADKPGLRQRQSSCVQASPNENASADVQLLANNAAECASSCTDGNICLGGICVSACNPVCSCDEKCQEGRCVADTTRPSSGGTTTGGSTTGSTGGSGSTGCPAGTVQSATGCVEKPLLGDWLLEANLEIDADGNLGTFSDRSQAAVAWTFTVYNVQLESWGWGASFGNGHQVSLSGDRITAPTGAQAQDRCSGNEELTGYMKLFNSGDLSIEQYGTGLLACGRLDDGPSNQILQAVGVISHNGFQDTMNLLSSLDWFENPTALEVTQTSGSMSR